MDQPRQRMRSRGALAAIRRWFGQGDGWLVATLVALPFVMRLPELLGLVHSNALGYTGSLGSYTSGFVGGQPTIDPNIGFTAQALGAQAAQQWFAGRVPWWNPYEGIGMPLAGEMQSAAFFPLTPLLILPQGQTIFHLCLQIIAGVATYYLLRELRLSRVASMTGAVIFEFNGVFAWLANAVVNPVPFLPLLLLGVERAFISARATEAKSQAERPRSPRDLAHALATGWAWIAVALALALLAGFPEVAYLDGALVAFWVVARLVALRAWAARGWFALKVGSGFIVGVAIAAPLLVAFVEYLRVADSGLHAQGTSALDLPALSLAQYLHPYLYGNIFQYAPPSDLFLSWANIGGYLGATVAFLALMGVFARRELELRIALTLWIALAVGRTFGAEPFAWLLNKLPLINAVAVYRYINASWIMAAVVLAALAIDDWRGSRRDKLKATVCAAITLGGLSLGSLWLARPSLIALFQNPLYSKKYAFGSVAIEWGTILALWICLLIGRDRLAPAEWRAAREPAERGRRLIGVVRERPHALLMGLAAAALTLAYFFYPTLANPRQVTVDRAAVSYLQAHIGYQRFFTLGPFAPNYGSYFDVASINHNDVPTSQRWVDYVRTRLDPYVLPPLFINMPRSPAEPSLRDELAAHLADYETVGVKYVLTSPGDQPFAQLPAEERPTLVYQDAVMWIYQTRAPTPLFSAQGGTCQVTVMSWTEANSACAAPATLVYHSLADAGWRAEVNGRPARITTADGAFQQIALPAGRSRVTFTYAPPNETPATLIALAGLLALLGALLAPLWSRRAGALLASQVVEAQERAS